jgi:hypothetical protein
MLETSTQAAMQQAPLSPGRKLILVALDQGPAPLHLIDLTAMSGPADLSMVGLTWVRVARSRAERFVNGRTVLTARSNQRRPPTPHQPWWRSSSVSAWDDTTVQLILPAEAL